MVLGGHGETMVPVLNPTAPSTASPVRQPHPQKPGWTQSSSARPRRGARSGQAHGFERLLRPASAAFNWRVPTSTTKSACFPGAAYLRGEYGRYTTSTWAYPRSSAARGWRDSGHRTRRHRAPDVGEFGARGCVTSSRGRELVALRLDGGRVVGHEGHQGTSESRVRSAGILGRHEVTVILKFAVAVRRRPLGRICAGCRDRPPAKAAKGSWLSMTGGSIVVMPVVRRVVRRPRASLSGSPRHGVEPLCLGQAR